MAHPTLTPAAVRATNALAGDEIRIEGREKVSGRAQYAADVRRPDTLWAAFATSPYAHARIVAIDTAAAREVPGVKAVLTGNDIGGKRHGRMLSDWSILAAEKAVFIGDRVAAVAAETREAAEEAARLVDVTYDELPAILDPRQALRADAPVVHPDGDRYAYAAPPRKPRAHQNVQGALTIQRGERDIDAVFAGAAHVFEHSFTTPRQHIGYIEPRSTIVWIDDDGTIHVCTPNKSPFKSREFMADVAGVPLDRVVIEPVFIGGDFGGKGITIDEFPCYFLARATGRPVRYVETYVDELSAGATRHEAYITLKSAVDAHGNFIAHRSDVLYNGGAYAGGKPTPNLLPGVLGYSSVGYRIPNVSLNICSVYTNAIPAAHMRAPADVQLFFAWEQHVDQIAAALGIDPIDFRLKNVIVDGEQAVTNEYMYKPAARAVLERLKTELAGTRSKGMGRGYSLVSRHTGGGKTSIKASLKPSGAIDVVVGVPDQGSGSHTVLRRVMGAELSIDPETISVRRGSTTEAALDPGAGSSRVTNIVGHAGLRACHMFLEEIEARTGLAWRDEWFVDAAGRSVAFADAAERACAGFPIDILATHDGNHEDGPEHPADFTFSAFAIDLNVDAESGALTIVDVLFVTDVGQIINPIGHQGQIDGGFVYGLGGALMEELPIDESGKVTTLSLGEYKLPTMKDLPPFRTVLVASPGLGPYGAKMAGELSNSGVAPAIINAIHDAVGIRIDTFPITSERIFDALRSTEVTP